MGDGRWTRLSGLQVADNGVERSNILINFSLISNRYQLFQSFLKKT